MKGVKNGEPKGLPVFYPQQPIPYPQETSGAKRGWVGFAQPSGKD